MTQRFWSVVVAVLVVGGLLAIPIADPAEAIHAGEDGDIGEFPWMVSIQAFDFGDGRWGHDCGGTLVAPDWILTAAHCVYDADESKPLQGDQLRVVVGKDKDSTGWDTHDFRTVGDPVFYPSGDGAPLYTRSPYWQGDLALLPLDQPVMDVPTVQLSYGEMPAGAALTAVGWGSTSDYWLDISNPDQLQKIDDILVRPDNECWDPNDSEYGADNQVIARVQICTKATGDLVTVGGPRKGDSGGPLLLWTGGKWIQLGIASHVPNATGNWLFKSFLDGDPNYTGWTSVAKHRDWITSTIGESSSAGPESATALIIDSSGSMGSNDPDDRRLDGAEAFLAASLPSDEVAVVDFDGSARILSEAVPVSENWDELSAAIRQINSSGGTNLGAGLTAGCDVLERANGAQRSAIFLTDGQGSYPGQASCFSSEGWSVFTVGLGSGVNQGLLAEIAAETGGRYLQMDSATNLVCEFLQIRAEIAGSPVSSCEPTGEIQSGELIQFVQSVAPFLRQVTFSNVWAGSDIEMTLTAPSGESYDRSSSGGGVLVSVGSSFEVFTIEDPEPGEWIVELYGAEIPEDGEPYTFSTVEIAAVETVADSDDDGFLDPEDNCAYTANPDQRDFDQDGTGDLCDDDVDGDVVSNAFDLCPDTLLPEVRPEGLKKNRYYAIALGDFVDGTESFVGLTVLDTQGCSGAQIIAADGLGNGHIKFGITKGALEEWIEGFDEDT